MAKKKRIKISDTVDNFNEREAKSNSLERHKKEIISMSSLFTVHQLPDFDLANAAGLRAP